jgi:hypothetical protein
MLRASAPLHRSQHDLHEGAPRAKRLASNNIKEAKLWQHELDRQCGKEL